MTITAVPGVRVGHWSDLEGLTGVTVVIPPEPNVTAVEVRGAAPGTRETALLAPGMKVEGVHAIALCGGSAFGLAAASGVAEALEAEGRGYPTLAGPVPIVPAAVIFDLAVGSNRARPGPAEGAAAYRAASTDPVEMGTVGAGTGATVAGWRGIEHLRKGGVGSASLHLGEAVVGALAVVNAVGDVFTLDGESLTGGGLVPGPPPFAPAPLESTTLVVLATDGAFGRSALQRLLVRAHDALAVCLRPGHTRYDGDAVFAVSCGDRSVDPDAAGEAAFSVVGRAIEAAIRSATAAGGIPALEGGG
ncbi:MAG: P1 family peptidase [Actinobacteria bacterium]|nr:P1 family peptidase [Actinomycetota bacterium]MBU1493298.1 P1 family peptidase [Actinomycetota bacterium]MBU1866831.1 P1 family peptidase [Actinomycetota bacterium]